MSLVEAAAALAALTRAQCDQCPSPHSCCEPSGCADAAAHTLRTEGKEAPGGDHPTLRYMGSNGCLLEPHRRPVCTLYCCTARKPWSDPEAAAFKPAYNRLADTFRVELRKAR